MYSPYAPVENVTQEEAFYPRCVAGKVEPEVPDQRRKESLEAGAVLPTSPRASAALNRRLLQQVLREALGVRPSDHAKEIDALIKLPNVPPYLAQAIDAVGNLSNMGTRPVKDTDTGEATEADPGAERLFEAVESLFGFASVQPKGLRKGKARLSQKLQAISKPSTKGCVVLHIRGCGVTTPSCALRVVMHSPMRVRSW
jgi:hypothetical protein